MRNILDEIKAKAKSLQKTIVLCEGEDSRVVQAAADATKEGIAKIVLLGDEDAIKAANPNVDLSGVEIVNPAPAIARRAGEVLAQRREVLKQGGEMDNGAVNTFITTGGNMDILRSMVKEIAPVEFDTFKFEETDIPYGSL